MPSCDSPNTSRRFALGARDVFLVGENLTCSVPLCRKAKVNNGHTTKLKNGHWLCMIGNMIQCHLMLGFDL